MDSPLKENCQPAPPKPVDPGRLLWDCAVGSFVEAMLVIIFGSLAVGIVGDLLREMLPSPPPGLGHGLELEKSVGWDQPIIFFKKHELLIVFSVLFALNLRGQLWRGGSGENLKPATRAQKIGRRLVEDWFGLIVRNAFGAMAAATVLVCLQQFSWTKIFFDSLLEPVVSAVHSVASAIFGKGRVDSIDAWLYWYRDNQLKFTFWLLYWAAICDDLGIPNLKTLARRIRQKFFLTEGDKGNEGEVVGRTSDTEHRRPNTE